jgi:Tol biopolymer transport system component
LTVGAAPFRTAALAPDGRSAVFAHEPGSGRRAQLWVVPRIRPDGNAARRLFSGAGSFADAAWSPDGRWVVVGWPEVDQWVFLRANGAGIRAVANVSEQFRSASFPRIEGWCCAP